MTVLLFFSFEHPESAAGVSERLRTSRQLRDDDVHSCALVAVGRDGRLGITTTDTPGAGSPLWGLFWEALFGLTVLVPEPRSSYGTSVGEIFGAIDRAGIDAAVRTRLRMLLRPGSSGLAIVASEPLPALEAQIGALERVEILSATLDFDADSELAYELGAINV